MYLKFQEQQNVLKSQQQQNETLFHNSFNGILQF